MPGRKPTFPASNSPRTPPLMPSDRLGCRPRLLSAASAAGAGPPSERRRSASLPAWSSGVSVDSRSQPPGRKTLTRTGAAGAAWAFAMSSRRVLGASAEAAYTNSPPSTAWRRVSDRRGRRPRRKSSQPLKGSRGISGPSCDPVPGWAVAGAGWQGRSEGVGLQAHDRARTPPGGDRRPIQTGADLQDGPLVAEVAGIAIAARRGELPQAVERVRAHAGRGLEGEYHLA